MHTFHQRRRRWLYIPFALAGVVCLAYYFLWRAGVHEIKTSVAAWAQEQQAAGLSVSYDEIRAAGFPFFLRVHIKNPSISLPDYWAWRTQTLTLDALPYDLNRLIFSAPGEQHLFEKNSGEWTLTSEDFRASIARDQERGWLFSATIGKARARRSSDNAEARLDSLLFDLAPDAADKTALTLALATREGRWRDHAGATELAHVHAQIAITHTNALSSAAPVNDWRGAGGAVIVDKFDAEIDGTVIALSGALGLDARNFPRGRLTTELEKPDGLARILGKIGVLSPDETRSAVAGLQLLAMAGGGKIVAPVEFRDGAAHIVGVKIADLPDLSFQAGEQAHYP